MKSNPRAIECAFAAALVWTSSQLVVAQTIPVEPGVPKIPPITGTGGDPASLEQVFVEQQGLLLAESTNQAVLWDEGIARTAFLGVDPTNSIVTNAPDPNALTLIVDADLNRLQYFTTLNAQSADTISTDELYSGGSLGLGLSGAGVDLAFWDGGDVFTNHQEFSSGGQRITDRDGASPVGVQLHPTHVAGTLIGKGVVANAKGMSPAATLDAYDFVNDLSEMARAVSEDDIRISNHSYGFTRGWGALNVGGQNFWAWYGDVTVSITEDYLYGFYDAYAERVDTVCYKSLRYLPVWAAGNERGSIGDGPPAQPAGHYKNFAGQQWLADTTTSHPPDGGATGYDTLSGYGVAKNVLTVAAVFDVPGGYNGPGSVIITPFSSFGPPDDGRVKPDISANGWGLFSASNEGTTSYAILDGTSMAAPSVAGSLGLLLEHYANLFGSADDLLASTLKGLAIHTADEAGPAPGPDYRFGWGLMNTKAAAQLLTAHAQSSNSISFIKEIYLNTGDHIEVPVTATGNQPLKVTLCWTDPPGTPVFPKVDPTNPALVNDLDLRVTSSTTTNYPWRLDGANPDNAATRSGDNDRDNVEQVLIDSPGAGSNYVIRVTHKGFSLTGGWQALSLIISGVNVEPSPELEIDRIVSSNGADANLVWASVPGALYRLRTSTNLVDWVDIAGDISATKTETAAEVAFDSGGGATRFWQVERLK